MNQNRINKICLVALVFLAACDESILSQNDKEQPASQLVETESGLYLLFPPSGQVYRVYESSLIEMQRFDAASLGPKNYSDTSPVAFEVDGKLSYLGDKTYYDLVIQGPTPAVDQNLIASDPPVGGVGASSEAEAEVEAIVPPAAPEATSSDQVIESFQKFLDTHRYVYVAFNDVNGIQIHRIDIDLDSTSYTQFVNSNNEVYAFNYSGTFRLDPVEYASIAGIQATWVPREE